MGKKDSKLLLSCENTKDIEYIKLIIKYELYNTKDGYEFVQKFGARNTKNEYNISDEYYNLLNNISNSAIKKNLVKIIHI